MRIKFLASSMETRSCGACGCRIVSVKYHGGNCRAACATIGILKIQGFEIFNHSNKTSLNY